MEGRPTLAFCTFLTCQFAIVLALRTQTFPGDSEVVPMGKDLRNKQNRRPTQQKDMHFQPPLVQLPLHAFSHQASTTAPTALTILP